MAGRGRLRTPRYFVNDDRDFPDLDRLFRECDWNRERQRWEDRPNRAEGETVH